MDRDYRNPQDVARASAERLDEALVREVRRGLPGRQFLLRRRFEYAGGRIGPLLFIGTLSRAWVDYMNANARATDMVSGVCTYSPGAGSTVVHLEVQGGRGATDGNLLEMNRAMRRLNIELAYAPAAGAKDSATAAPPTAAPEPSPAAAAPDLAASARAIRDRFDAFKAAPTAEGLADLNARVEAWRAELADAPAMQGSKADEFIEKLAALLAAKGKTLVAKAGG